MARAKISQQPSPYPSTVFHGIRVAQVLSSVIVTSFLGFFVYHLNVEYIQVPWTFILVSLLPTRIFTMDRIFTTDSYMLLASSSFRLYDIFDLGHWRSPLHAHTQGRPQCLHQWLSQSALASWIRIAGMERDRHAHAPMHY